MSLMQTCAQRRLGLEIGMDPTSHEILMNAIAQAATTEQERDDFKAQAEMLAESALTANWDMVVSLTEKGGGVPRFRRPEDWPDVPIRPIDWIGTDASEPAAVSEHDLRVQHLVAHGLVGAALTDSPVSIGFGGFRVLKAARFADDVAVTVLSAGGVSDLLIAGVVDPEDRCGCAHHAMAIVLDTLGIPHLEGQGMLPDLLASTGRTADVEEYMRARCVAAGTLVERLRQTSLYREECHRLPRLGRTVIHPAAVTAALERSA
jgi:hypothetical protein